MSWSFNYAYRLLLFFDFCSVYQRLDRRICSACDDHGDSEIASLEVSASPEHPKLNLNDADAATLQKELSGVGEAKAKAIVAYRETNGPFASVDELLEVKGIGKAILDRNREKLEVN